MPTDSEEMQKLRAAGFDHNQARAVLHARAMARGHAPEEAIAEMLRRNGFSPSQALVIASSACRHVHTGSRANVTGEPSESPAATPLRRYPSYALAGAMSALVAVAILAAAVIFHSSFSTRSAAVSSSEESRDAVLRLRDAAPEKVFQNTSITGQPSPLSPPAPTVAPAAAEPDLRNGKLVRVSQTATGKPTPAPVRPIGQLPTEEESRREAARTFPTLPIKGSPFNTLFVSEYRQLRGNSPRFFDSPDWPMTLAQTCDRYLGRHGLSSAGTIPSASLMGKAPEVTYRPSASGILFELYPGGVGPGDLRVANGGDRNAICKLIDLKIGAKVFTFVVLARSSYYLIGIPKGTYRLTYAHGDSVLTGTDQFTSPGEFAEFKDDFEVARRPTATGFEYPSYEVTLDQESGNRWPTGRISAREFERY